jgi:hypothetical protein
VAGFFISTHRMILQFLIISCISTSLMTMFSYGVAAILKQQFREPELLNLLAIRLKILNKTSDKNHPLGWIVHYAVGVFFVVSIELVRGEAGFDPAILYYLLAGGICGLIGVVMWFSTFRMHPNPPKLWYNAFYIQLIFAHIVFGLGIWSSVLILSVA